MAQSYPIMLDVTSRDILIVGGGAVAARKCRGLLACGATLIRVVSPAFSSDIPVEVTRVNTTYQSSQLDEAGLVFATTNDSTVNTQIVRDAQARGIFVCRADTDETFPGDFSTPAHHRSGAVTVAVSTAGSPALSTRLRDQLVRSLDGDLLMLADALQQLRPEILARSMTDEDRRALFRRLADDEAAAVLRDGGMAALQQWIQAVASHA